VTDDFLSEYDPAYGKRPEFAALIRESAPQAGDRSMARLTGAENLLAKAMVALAAGDGDRAEKLIRRTAEMAYDEHEEDWPGISGASLLVHDLVVDEFEASEFGDSRWLEVALDVHGRADGPARAELASTIHGFAAPDDPDVSRAERRRIQQEVGNAPISADLGHDPELTLEQRLVIIRSLVAAAVALHEAYAAG